MPGEQTCPPPSYWAFWWPLALVGLAGPLGKVVINGGLARLDDGIGELATVAWAQGLVHLFQASLAFLPQTVTVLVASRTDLGRCRRLAYGLTALLILPLLLLGGPLRPLLGHVYGIEGALLDAVAGYLLLLAPLLLLDASVGWLVGVLVRHRRTGWVSLATLANLAIVGAVCVIAVALGWPGQALVVTAAASGSVVQVAVLALAWRRTKTQLASEAGPALGVGRFAAFFWPLAITSTMFAASRPVIYACVGWTEQAVFTVAVLRVAFDLGLLAQLPVNQFRHLMVTFANQDRAGVARFMARCTAVIAGVTLIVILTPLGPWLLADGLGLAEDLIGPVRAAWLVLVLVPVLVAWRNWHHGLAMLRRRTGPMATAAVLRVVATFLLCALAAASGRLDHLVGAIALLLGFAVEAVVVRQSGRRAEANPV